MLLIKKSYKIKGLFSNIFFQIILYVHSLEIQIKRVKTMNSDKTSFSNAHPTLWIRESKGKILSGKTIVLGVTGSIAAVQTIQLARELIRYGASVHAVATDAALHIIHEEALHYATGNPVITALTGRVEHVEFFGASGRADLFLIAPATANTISKIAAGIDDTPVTTFATTAIGENKKIMIVPAMHESMYRHPKVLENLAILKSWGIDIVGPRIEEGIAKIADIDEIVLRVLRTLGGHSLAGTSVFVTSGATAEAIDPIRILTNRASGKTGDAIAREAYIRGAEVYLFHRTVSKYHRLPDFHDVFTESCSDMIHAVTEKVALANPPKFGKNILISAAAISDYTLDAAGSKIKSGDSDLILKFRPTKKLIEEACYTDPDLFIVGFKAEADVLFEELIDLAVAKIEDGVVDMVVANDVREKGMGTDDNDVYLVTPMYLKTRNSADIVSISGSKEKIAVKLLDYILVEMSRIAAETVVFSEPPQGFTDSILISNDDTGVGFGTADEIETKADFVLDSKSETVSSSYLPSDSPSQPKRPLRKKTMRVSGFKKRNES